ncbi:M1 family peptidase [Actinomadura darangshiensis]|uniref:Aminopeptidase N n=1 Tax=Actinomadura darangshiensis TaxID=705336 RepID=A0A4R5BHW9_9ACTN|nr:M1 family metallopeptidase [Actinomadura darangshiensis]TDD83424.1 M1 family peptidase [Actinomadura darangshiensis]
MAIPRSAHRPPAVLAIGAVTLALLAPAASADIEYGPGAPGLGDPYFPDLGNGGYDVRDYNLKTAYDPGTDHLTGTTTITATATQNLSRFNLDFYKMNVRSVRVNGRKASFDRTGERELEITPRRGLRESRPFTVVVQYDGVPETLSGPIVFDLPYGFLHTNDGATVVSEPNAASTWFPSNDNPRDKAYFTIETTVPRGLKAISNGHLVKRWTAHGKDTFRWREDRPMTTYLATVSIGRFNVSTTTTPKGVTQLDAVDSAVASDPDSLSTPAWTTRATDELADYFGPYPFTSTGSIIENNSIPPLNIENALETQTRPTYQKHPIEKGVVHEMSHAWFGDSVSPARWKDVWLNEGHALWTEKYWAEKHGGPSAEAAFEQIYADPPPMPPGRPAFWDVATADPGRDQMFHRSIYFRGGMALQALRHRIGDEPFMRLTRTWLADHQYGNGTTEQYEALAEQISGQDLGEFFRTWLHTTGKPPAWW